MRHLVIAAVLALAACTRLSYQRVTAPDGSQAWALHCGGGQADCMRVAGQKCPGGYDVLSSAPFDMMVRCK